jgi:hypothetical protein
MRGILHTEFARLTQRTWMMSIYLTSGPALVAGAPGVLELEIAS